MWLIILALSIFIFFYFGDFKTPQPINGIYSQEGPLYPLKVVAFWILLTLQRISNSRKPQRSIEELEKPQEFSNSPRAFDAIFFSGACPKTGLIFMLSTERRPDNITFALAYFYIPGKGLYKGEWLPKSEVLRKEDVSFTTQEGITLTPIEPMRQWKLEFKGKLKHNETGKSEDFEISFDWKSDESCFMYDTQMSKIASAKAFAREPWNRQYFDDLKKQVHTWNRMGKVRGSIKSSSDSSIDIQVKDVISFRDHSFGKARDWKLMHRYAYHHIFLQDGTKIVAAIICQPHTCSKLDLGYISMKSGVHIPLDYCSFSLANFGENGSPPDDYGFICEAGGHEYQVQCKAMARTFHYVGVEREAKNFELFMDYNVNNVPGYGMVEWNYRNLE